MTVPPSPDHLLTLDEWDALPEDNSRHYELVEGKLLASPQPALLHQRAMTRPAWIIDLDPPAVSLSAYLLVDGNYEVLADSTGTVELRSPVPLTIDLESLTARRPRGATASL